MTSRIFMLCDRYESGFGHGLKNDGLDLSKTPHADPEMGEAYQIGYEAGQQRAAAQEPADTQDGLPSHMDVVNADKKALIIIDSLRKANRDLERRLAEALKRAEEPERVREILTNNIGFRTLVETGKVEWVLDAITEALKEAGK